MASRRTEIRQGLRCIVTAGASGIGRAIAETLHEHGARVHVCDVSGDAVRSLQAASPGIEAAQADVAVRGEVDRYFDEALTTLGGLDLLVNNAGIAGPTARVEDIDPDDWDRTVAINLSGQFYCARRAVPALRAGGDGSLISISSVAGRLGYAMRTPYSATKWAVIGFVESLAKELGPDGVRVNAILPGIVEGARMDGVIAHRADALDLSFDEMRTKILGNVSLRRMVSAEDVADMVLFLCSPAGRNISGQSLSVCGNVETI